MFEWQRFAVHADGHHAVAPVEGDVHRESARPAVEARTEHLLGTVENTDAVEQILEQNALPHGGADERSAHRVRDATQRDRTLDLRQREQVGVGECEGILHQAVDGERPRITIDGRERHGRVDAVEVVVRCEERFGGMEAVGGRSAHGVVDIGQCGRPLRLDAAHTIVLARTADQSGREGHHAHGAGGTHELSTIESERSHRLGGATAREPLASSRPHEHNERCDTGHRTDDGSDVRPSGGAGALGRTGQTEHGEQNRAPRVRRPAPSGAEGGGDDGQHDPDADAQRGLVVGAEEIDGQVLQPARYSIDERTAHRVDGRRGVSEGGDEDAHAHRAETGQQTGDGADDSWRCGKRRAGRPRIDFESLGHRSYIGT